MPLDHEKKYKKPEQVYGLHPPDQPGTFRLEIAPFHVRLPGHGTCKKNKNQQPGCKKKPGILLAAMAKQYMTGGRNTGLQAHGALGYAETTQEEMNAEKTA
jgi:hypothetical protein